VNEERGTACERNQSDECESHVNKITRLNEPGKRNPSDIQELAPKANLDRKHSPVETTSEARGRSGETRKHRDVNMSPRL
jgi:hypothetical protein